MHHTSSPRNTVYSGLLASCRIFACVTAFLLCAPAFAEDSLDLGSATPKAFPDIAYKDEQGVGHTLSADKGKFTLVHFWATWCAPCVKEFPQIDALQQTYGDKGLKIIAISLDGAGNMGKIKEFYTKAGITHVKAYVDDGSATATAGVRGMPTSFFINAGGQNIATVEGPVDWTSPAVKTFIEQNLK